VREYVDAGVPAKLEQQTELRRLLAELTEYQDASFVVIWEYPRLARDMAQLDAITGRLADLGVTIATITGVETVNRPDYQSPTNNE
jgi:DNA invertase Pin-like site-specific DNA recombinase